jgi:hypothetical protein
MMTHLLRVTAAITFIILCTLLPFLPGRYDSLAVPLSVMSQFLGRAGLLFVPVGALWIASGSWSPRTPKDYAFALTAVIVFSLLWLFVSLGAVLSAGWSLGVATLALGAYVIFRLLPRLGRLRTGAPPAASVIALYLIVMPLAMFLLQLALVRPAIEFSRSQAIRNSARLIADIEQHRGTHGRYPPSLLSVWADYSPSVIGIERFHYEPRGEAYNLVFEQLTFELATREFVVYNPRDQHAITAHAMDLLQLTPEELEVERRRGHFAVHNTPHAHWKYFWFD